MSNSLCETETSASMAGVSCGLGCATLCVKPKKRALTPEDACECSGDAAAAYIRASNMPLITHSCICSELHRQTPMLPVRAARRLLHRLSSCSSVQGSEADSSSLCLYHARISIQEVFEKRITSKRMMLGGGDSACNCGPK